VELSKYKDTKDISLGIELFNQAYFKAKSELENKTKKSILSRISMDKNNSLYRDYYTKIVANMLIKTDWYDLFKLNFRDTMKLEYSEYVYLKDILDEYTKRSKKEKEKINVQLNKLIDKNH
jgi:hypothetical protein